MRRLQLALVACPLLLGHSVLAHDAVPGNSTEVNDCDYAVATVSRSDFIDCESNHNHAAACFDWAHERKAKLQSQVGEPCENEVRTLKGPGGCKDQGKKIRILYHQHRGLECTASEGCDGKDGNPPPHDHWEFVHLTVDCGGSGSTAAGESAAAVGSAAVHAEGLHGSISFSQEDDGGYAWGIAWRFDNRFDATREAVTQCRREGGTNCTEVGWFENACGALAIGDENGYGAGWGDSTAAAERDALRQCRVANDNCRIEVARCSDSRQAAGGYGTAPGSESPSEGNAAKTESTDEEACKYNWCTYFRYIYYGNPSINESPGNTRAEAEEGAKIFCDRVLAAARNPGVDPDAHGGCDILETKKGSGERRLDY